MAVGTTYYLVTSGTGSSASGTFTDTISGPGSLVAVPEPASLAVVSLVVAAGLVDGGVIKAGVTADGIAPDYAPQLDFYRLQMNALGMDAVRIPAAALASTPPGALVATCDPGFTRRVRVLGANLSDVAGCVAVRRR